MKNTTFLGFAVFEKWSCYKLSPFDIQNFSSTLGEKKILFGEQENYNKIMSAGKNRKGKRKTEKYEKASAGKRGKQIKLKKEER